MFARSAFRAAAPLRQVSLIPAYDPKLVKLQGNLPIDLHIASDKHEKHD
jgi:hypothetical protein